jgi:TRAP-type C4-dicarboxylate transport system permease small subunit
MTSAKLASAAVIQYAGRMTLEDGAVLPKLYTLADRGLRALEFIGILFAGVMLLITMCLMSLDAFLRYFFNAPLQWQYTLTSSFLLVALVCPALAWGYRTGGYIRVSGTWLLPPVWRGVLIRAGLLLSCGYISVLAWKSGEYFLDVFQSGETAISTLKWPVWLSWIWVPTGLGLLSARLLVATFAPAQDLELDGDIAEEI